VSGHDAPGAATRRPTDAATVIAIGFVIAGWALYLFLGPLSVFFTWYGDCVDTPCAVPGALDEATYVFDVLWWLVFPVLAFLAYRGLRWAWAALLAIAMVVDLQIAAGALGASGFDAFWFTLPAAAVLTFGAGLGLAMSLPRFRDRAGAASAGQLASIGCLAIVVSVVALQGVILGATGPIVAILLLMAIALIVIVVAAYSNRNRRGPGRPEPDRTIRRRRR
jgi:hypothetical protein